MARNFLPFPFSPYKGPYTSKPFDTGRGQQKGLMVAAEVIWNLYTANGGALGAANPNFNVIFDLNIAGPNSVGTTWIIQSVYIDNEGVDFPVYVYFTDTQFTVSCPANSAGWYQVFTNARKAFVCGIGITDNAIANAQRTRVFFTDSGMVPSLDQEAPSAVSLWLGSTSIQRTNQLLPGFGPPALGDQTATDLSDFSSLNPTGVSTLLPAQPSGFYYLTMIELTAPFISVICNQANAGILRFDIFIQETTNQIGNIERTSSGVACSDVVANGIAFNVPISRLSNINLRLDAKLKWGYSIANPVFDSRGGNLTSWAARIECLFGFTYNPFT